MTSLYSSAGIRIITIILSPETRAVVQVYYIRGINLSILLRALRIINNMTRVCFPPLRTLDSSSAHAQVRANNTRRYTYYIYIAILLLVPVPNWYRRLDSMYTSASYRYVKAYTINYKCTITVYDIPFRRYLYMYIYIDG